jgi:hypothetical protein
MTWWPPSSPETTLPTGSCFTVNSCPFSHRAVLFFHRGFGGRAILPPCCIEACCCRSMHHYLATQQLFTPLNATAGRAVYKRAGASRPLCVCEMLVGDAKHPCREEGAVEPIRRGIEGFLRGRYGYEGHRALWVLAVPVLIWAILLAGWLLIGPLLTIPRFSTEGPVVRNGVAAIVACGKKQGVRGMGTVLNYAPEPRTGTWWPEKKGDCTVYYHRPPDPSQRIARHERAQE